MDWDWWGRRDRLLKSIITSSYRRHQFSYSFSIREAAPQLRPSAAQALQAHSSTSYLQVLSFTELKATPTYYIYSLSQNSHYTICSSLLMELGNPSFQNLNLKQNQISDLPNLTINKTNRIFSNSIIIIIYEFGRENNYLRVVCTLTHWLDTQYLHCYPHVY